MTNTKITRTINTAHATITYVNMATMKIETVADYQMITTQKVTEKDFEKYFNENRSADDAECKLLKVEDIHYTSALYEMDIFTFMSNATYIGEGRTNL